MFWPLPLIAVTLLGLSASLEQLLGALGGAVVTAVAAYLIARRSTSGSVRMSDAATIFQAAETIRKELRDEVVGLRAEVKVLRDSERQLSARVVLLEAEVARLGGKPYD